MNCSINLRGGCLMKRLISLFLICFILSGCNSEQLKEVQMFNAQTEITISNYERLKEKVSQRVPELIKGIADGSIASDLISSDFNYSEWTSLLQSNANSIISDEPLVQTSDFYTALGLNSVTQIIIFSYRGTTYLAEVLWVDEKIDTLNLEVK